jgi:hypothetical protein
VSAAVLGLCFGVSVQQQVNARLRRLEAAGLIARTDGAVARAADQRDGARVSGGGGRRSAARRA